MEAVAVDPVVKMGGDLYLQQILQLPITPYYKIIQEVLVELVGLEAQLVLTP